MSSFIPLVLGTAQFGGSYGITNRLGCPSLSDAFKILNIFFEAGYSMVDTAVGYGTAHEKISEWIKSNFQFSRKNINVITKISIQGDLALFSDKVSKICEQLGIENLYSILIHNPSSLKSDEDFECLNESIKLLKQKNIIKKAGISVYSPQEVYNVPIKTTELDIIQCPANILDQRFLKAELQDFCARKNIEIHGRSLFLQGLLLASSLPSQLTNSEATEALNNYHAFLDDNKLTALQACSLFARQNTSKISHWVVGFNAPHEIQEFLDIMKKTEMKNDFLFDAFKNKELYLDPRTWSYTKSC